MLNFNISKGDCKSDDNQDLLQVNNINLKSCKNICDNYLDCKALSYSKKKQICKLYGGNQEYKGNGNDDFKCFNSEKYKGYNNLNSKMIKTKLSTLKNIENEVDNQNISISKLNEELKNINYELDSKSNNINNINKNVEINNKNINESKNQLITNERMLQLTKENVDYKQKIIYSLIALIVLCFVIMMIGYAIARK